MPSLSLVLDVSIVVLLVVTLIYALKLSRQLTKLREGEGELKQLVKNLSRAAARAEVAIKDMREAAGTTGAALQRRIEDGRALFEELQFINESSNNIANRLERLSERGGATLSAFMPEFEEIAPSHAMQTVREELEREEDGFSFDPPPPPRRGQPRSQAERDLLDALKARKLG